MLSIPAVENRTSKGGDDAAGLLKCLMRPGKRFASWLGTIAEERDDIAVLLEDSPSLRALPAEILDRCYPLARRKAAYQMRLSERGFPQQCPFAIGEVLDRRRLLFGPVT